MRRRSPIVAFLLEVGQQWSRDNALSLGAALAYYALFSLAPLLVLVIAIAGLALGRSAAEGTVVGLVQGAVGGDAAHMIQELIVRASEPTAGAIATAASLGTMLFGASGVFGQLQSSLNRIWGVPASGGVRGLVRRRATSFALILVIGLLLFLSTVASTVLAAATAWIAAYAAGADRVLPLADFGLNLALLSTLFALLFKYLPDANMRWRDVWVGSVLTALLFILGRGLIALYLGRASTSLYGAAASLIVVLLWIYYSAQILLIGAEFTEVWSRHFGSRAGQPAEPTPS